MRYREAPSPSSLVLFLLLLSLFEEAFYLSATIVVGDDHSCTAAFQSAFFRFVWFLVVVFVFVVWGNRWNFFLVYTRVVSLSSFHWASTTIMAYLTCRRRP